MAVKYRRETLSREALHHGHRYEIRPGQGGPRARRRLLFIYFAVIVLAAGSLVFHYLSQNQINRWLPERPGQALVLEKHTTPGTYGPRHLLRVRLFVPAATGDEAAFLPEDFPDRDAAIGPKEFEQDVETPQQDWESVSAGARLRASYQINIRRTDVMIRALYLDHLDAAPAALP